MLINSKHFCTPFCTLFVYLTMKQKVRFILKNPSAVSSTAINMLYSWGYKDSNGKYKNLKYATRQSVDPELWDKDEQEATGPYSAGINAELDTVKAAINKIYFKLQDSDLTPQILKDELDIILGRREPGVKQKDKPKKKVYLLEYITRYISEMESGVRRTFKNPLKRMAPSTITSIKSFKTKITDYEDATCKRYTFNDINMKFYKLFIAWLGERHTVNSAGKSIRQLKTIMNAAHDDGVHNNLEFRKKAFKVTSELVDTIYLTEDEIEQLINKDITKPHLIKARDLFLVGCFTLQRVSDYYKIDKRNMIKSTNGVDIIRFKQQKSETTVIFPLKSPGLRSILEKYNYELPKMPDQKINDCIKIICKDPEDHEGEHTSLHLKSDDISTHTGRRSGCTNMYRAGIPASKIMKLSGHKSESEFRKYIRVTDEENAEDIVNYEYFNR